MHLEYFIRAVTCSARSERFGNNGANFSTCIKRGKHPKVSVSCSSHLSLGSLLMLSCLLTSPVCWGLSCGSAEPRSISLASERPLQAGTTVGSTWGLLAQALALQKDWSGLGKDSEERCSKVCQSCRAKYLPESEEFEKKEK